MPRTASLSGSSRVWFMRRKPSDWTVARISGRAPIADFTRVALSIAVPFGSGTLGPSGRYGGHLPTAWGGRAFVRGGQALADHLVDVLAAKLGDLRCGLGLLQRGQGRAHGVDGVVSAVRL